MDEQLTRVIAAFTQQAAGFDAYQHTVSKEAFTRFALSRMALTASDDVLEVAAGTCAFGRCIAPLVRHVTELDVTEAMLTVGRREADKQGLTNVSFLRGTAEDLPFADGRFDCVTARLAFHHFADPAAAFAQMRRVTKPGGRIAVIDMRARDEALRDTADRWERLRDPSHVRCLSEKELRALAAGLNVTCCETIRIPVPLTAWMALTQVAEPARGALIRAMEEELSGGAPTGLEAFREGDQLMFIQQWLLLVAEVPTTAP